MQRLPLIGQSFAHSAVEAVQRAAFEASAVEIEIEPWERKPHQLPDAIEALRDSAFAGALIASPHKERTATLTDLLSDDAKVSGAANVVVRDGVRLRGHNTDVDGVRAGLTALLPKVQAKWPRQALVLGAGGGAPNRRPLLGCLLAGAPAGRAGEREQPTDRAAPHSIANSRLNTTSNRKVLARLRVSMCSAIRLSLAGIPMIFSCAFRPSSPSPCRLSIFQ